MFKSSWSLNAVIVPEKINKKWLHKINEKLSFLKMVVMVWVSNALLAQFFVQLSNINHSMINLNSNRYYQCHSHWAKIKLVDQDSVMEVISFFTKQRSCKYIDMSLLSLYLLNLFH